MNRQPDQQLFFRRPAAGASLFDLDGALGFFIALAEALQNAHAAGGRYGALCLANILLQDDGALRLNEEAASGPATLATLAYIAPEQTGRMNRKVDLRSDFYSLGVVLYELATGRLPFEAGSLMELVHAHIAKRPDAPASVNAALPPVLSELILKLLAKNAEDRYQSLAGLVSDLQRCRLAFELHGRIAAFPLAENDHSEQLQIPEKLYGREAEVKLLHEAFERSARGAAELLLVTGYAGIGKSSLINEVQHLVSARHGYFVSGKFEQFKRNIPYSALHHALRELVRQILTEDELRIAEWRALLLTGLGPNAQLVIEAIPELEYIVGAQPAMPRSVASMTSYAYVMQKFVGVFARRHHPLVLFLDDLQWADVASLKLLAMLMKDLEHPALLLIGAYRDNEVQPDDVLAQTIASIASETEVHRIALQALRLPSITALVMDTFGADAAVALPLARLIFRKTMGNPFFVGQFLRSLFNENLLQFHARAWRWDIDDIEALAITDNVVDLLTRELLRLPQETRGMLALAACIGNRFELATLAPVSQQDEAQARERISQAINAGLVKPLEISLVAARARSETYVFLHDRVQQAAYEGIAADQRGAVHLKIGQVMLNAIPPAQHEERIFDIVPQLNQGRSLLASTQDRDMLAGLNLLAAKRARESAALEVHREFVALAEELGAVAVWADKPAFMHALTMEKVSAAFARGDYQAMAELCRMVGEHAVDIGQAVAAKNMLLRCYGSSFRPVELMAAGIEMMQLVGIAPPAKLGRRHLWWSRFRLRLALFGRDPASLADLPEPRDAQYNLQLLATTALLGFGFGFYKDSAVIQWLSLELIRKSIRYGVSPLSAYAYVVWGSTLAGKYDRPLIGYKFARVAAALGPRGSMVTLSTVSLFEGTVRHRREAMRASLTPLMDTYQKASERGDRTGAVVALQFADSMRFHSGLELSETLQHMRRDVAIARRMDYAAILSMMLPMAMTVARLHGENIDDLTGGLQLDQFAVQRTAAGDLWSVFYLRAVQCVAEYYFGETEAAAAHAEQAIALPGFGYGTPHSAYLMFFSSLARLELVAPAASLSADTLRFVLRMQKKLASWARHAPMNYLHKWQLVQGALLLVQGQATRATHCLEQAIAGALANDYPGDAALANEWLARYLLKDGKPVQARARMEEAHAHYTQWGAFGKLAQLEALYPALLKRTVAQRQEVLTGDQRLDIDTIIQVSQTLSSEIQLDKLLQKLMLILIENAGAQHGVLLLKKEAQLQVQATYTTHAGQAADVIEVLQGTDYEAQPGLCLAIVNYVKRTRERLVLGDAQKDSRFNGDAYVRSQGVKSVLCIPLQKQGEVMGIFYLENNLAADTFTPTHTELLMVLSTQIAISLENAGLYNELEQKIAVRTEVISRRNDALKRTLASLRQTQKQLVESEKLASLGQLVAGVAHEINTPVGIAVTGASTLAEQTAALNLQYQNGSMRRSDMEKYLHTAGVISKLLLSNMERAAALIQSFKAVAVDQVSEERRRFHLRAYIEDVLQNLSPMLRKTRHLITVECEASIEIDTYPGALAQMLTNFVSNALLHAFAGIESGQMAIHVSAQDDDMIALRFSDNGRGIPAEHMEKIFDPFFTTMRGRGGSGLGLNIIYNLVTGRLRGHIEAASRPGEGTTFTVVFPANPVSPASAVLPDPADAADADEPVTERLYVQ